MIAGGLFKKVVIANYLATELVDPVFAAPTGYGGPDLLLAVYGYAVQIYCDFSAYSDMAIGIAGTARLPLSAEFQPALPAERLREFWQRWHISLSTWLRDYLYMPLGGNRHGRLDLPQPADHDAAGRVVARRRLEIRRLGRAARRRARGRAHGAAADRPARRWAGRALVATLLVFHFVCLAWIFFRAEDFAVARLYLAGLGHGWHDGVQQAGPPMLALIALGMAGQYTPPALFERTAAALGRLPVWGIGATAGIVVAAIDALGPEGVAPFIYFRF